MADTVIPSALVQKAWAKDTWTAAIKESFFSKFMGKTSESIIHVKDDLKKEAGDTITLSLRMPLLGAGVEGDDVLEGNEEAMQFYDLSVTINQIRHAVRLKGKMEEKKTAKNLRAEAKAGLKDWYAEKFDALFFSKLTATPTSYRTVYGGDATAEAEIVDADKMTCAVISKAKRAASKRITYVVNGVTHVVPKIRPVKVNGKSVYVMLVTLEQLRDLRTDSVWIAAQEYANVRGEENPIFSGAEGMYDGVVLYAHENVSVTATGDTGANVGHALLLGAQAGCLAVGSDPEWNEETFDYGNKVGFEVGAIFGIAKSKFDGQDFACVHVMTGNKAD